MLDEQHYATLLSQHCRPPAAKVMSTKNFCTMMDTKFLFCMKADSEASLIKMGKSKPQKIKFFCDTFFWSCGMASMNLQLLLKPKNVLRCYVRFENKNPVIRLKGCLEVGKFNHGNSLLCNFLTIHE